MIQYILRHRANTRRNWLGSRCRIAILARVGWVRCMRRYLDLEPGREKGRQRRIATLTNNLDCKVRCAPRLSAAANSQALDNLKTPCGSTLAAYRVPAGKAGREWCAFVPRSHRPPAGRRR